jgi:hypothetical protein
MPLDDTGYEGRISDLDKIERVISLLSDECSWCKHQLKTDDGRRCIAGAMAEAGASSLKDPILRAIKTVTGRGHLRVEEFNDFLLTTHAEVLQVLHQTREDIIRATAEPKRAGPLRQVFFGVGLPTRIPDSRAERKG